MSVKDFKDAVLVTTTTTGTGTLTQSAAVAPYQAPAAGDDAKTFAIFIYEVDANGNPNGAWEVTESTYTHSGTTWSRGTLLSSSTGSRINFAAGTKRIAVIVPADVLLQLVYANGKVGGQVIAGGTTANSLTLANNLTGYDAGAGNYAQVSSSGVLFFAAGGAVARLSHDAFFSRSIEIGTDPAGAAPGAAGKATLWTEGSGGSQPAVATDRVVIYAWDFAAGDARVYIKGETGSEIIIGGGQVRADSLHSTFSVTATTSLTVGTFANIASWARVGSATSPANTGTGDLTVSRIDIGANAAFPTVGRVLQTSATLTNTTGTHYAHSFSVSAVPASNSSATVSGLTFSIYIAAGAGVTQNVVQGQRFEVIHRQTGAVSEIEGVKIIACAYDASSPATPGTVSAATALSIKPYERPAGTSAGTINFLYGIGIHNIGDAGLTCGSYTGFLFSNPSGGTFTNIYGFDISGVAAGTSKSIGARFQYSGVRNGIGATDEATALRVAIGPGMGNQTATTTLYAGIYVEQPFLSSTTNVRTITNSYSLYVGGPPTSSGNITFTNPAYSVYVASGNSHFGGNVVITGVTTLATSLTGVLRADAGVVSVDADVTDLVGIATDTASGKIEIAIQSEMETATDNTRAVTPGRMHFHPGVAKFWAQVTGGGTPSLTTNYNVTSIADTGVGRMTITINTDFSSVNWPCSANGIGSAGVGTAAMVWGVSKAAGSIEMDNADLSATPVAEDPSVGYDVVGFGDHA